MNVIVMNLDDGRSGKHRIQGSRNGFGNITDLIVVDAEILGAPAIDHVTNAGAGTADI
jgi:hypothetical protein